MSYCVTQIEDSNNYVLLKLYSLIHFIKEAIKKSSSGLQYKMIINKYVYLTRVSVFLKYSRMRTAILLFLHIYIWSEV